MAGKKKLILIESCPRGPCQVPRVAHLIHFDLLFVLQAGKSFLPHLSFLKYLVILWEELSPYVLVRKIWKEAHNSTSYYDKPVRSTCEQIVVNNVIREGNNVLEGEEPNEESGDCQPNNKVMYPSPCLALKNESHGDHKQHREVVHYPHFIETC